MRLDLKINGGDIEEVDILNLVVIDGVYVLLLTGDLYYSLGPLTVA